MLNLDPGPVHPSLHKLWDDLCHCTEKLFFKRWGFSLEKGYCKWMIIWNTLSKTDVSS